MSAEDELLELWSQFHEVWVEQASPPARDRRAVFAIPPRASGLRTPGGPGRPTVRAEGMDAIVDLVLARFFSPAFRESGDPVVARFETFLRDAPVDGYAGSCDALAAGDLRELARQVEARSLVIVGTHDEATPPADARALHALLPDAELVELPGAGHLANLEQPVRFEALVSEFLTHESPRDDQEVAHA